MRKLLGVAILAILIATAISCAESISDFSTGEKAGVTNGALNTSTLVTLGTRTVHRNNLTTNDTFTYGSGDTAKMDLTGYKYALIEIFLGGTTPQWDVTPEFGDSALSQYTKGQKRTVTQNERYIVEVDGESEFIARCDGSSGTNPTITVVVTPFN